MLDHSQRWDLLQSKLQRDNLLLRIRGRLMTCLLHKQRTKVSLLSAWLLSLFIERGKNLSSGMWGHFYYRWWDKCVTNNFFPSTFCAVSNWNQSSHSTELRSQQNQASAPFLSITESGRCSPRSDPNLPPSGDWLSGLDTTRNGVSGLDNLQADGTGCSGPAGDRSGTVSSCFRTGFGSHQASNEDDESSFPFLDQERENQNSNQNSVLGQAADCRDIQQDHPQAPSGESPWRTRGDRDGRSPINNTRQATNFGNRDPLRPQSNSLSLALRHANALGHPPASSGGNGRPYTCPYCTKCFAYPSHQRRHLLRHTGVRLHPCQFCDKSFLTPSELTVHTRTHTGERPFGCAQCGKRFARSGNLRAHQRDVHMGKRPFACTECGKRFAHRGNLRVHNHRVHQGDPYFIDDQPEPDIGTNPIWEVSSVIPKWSHGKPNLILST